MLLQEELRSLRARNERFDRLQEENIRLEFANKVGVPSDGHIILLQKWIRG